MERDVARAKRSSITQPPTAHRAEENPTAVRTFSRTGSEVGLFVDKSFPVHYNSKLVWKRPKDICVSPKFIVDGATRTDVCQGILSDCWFLSAVASLSQHRALLERVVPEGQGFDREYTGCFRFQFWQYGEWKEVEVDDFLPTEGGQLVYLHSAERDEFWSALLEKAYAKLKGGYQALQLGFPHEALVDMTGGVTEIFTIPLLPPDLAGFLRPLLEKGALINCVNTQGEMEKKNEQGILFKHAYSVTGLEKVRCYLGEADLVRVRNPWGHTEWTGPWSDNSWLEWAKVSAEEQARVQRVQQIDGEFWMEVSDFQRNFNMMEVCHLSDSTLSGPGAVTRPWECATHHGSWVPGISAGGPPSVAGRYWLNPQFRMTLLEEDDDPSDPALTCSFLVALMQKHQRQKGVTLDIGLHIYQVSTNKMYLPSWDLARAQPLIGTPQYNQQREVVIRSALAPGHYIIIPSTSMANQEGEFVLRVYTEKGNKAVPADKVSSDLRDKFPTPAVSVLPSQDAARELFMKHAAAGGRCGAVELQGLLKEVIVTGALAGSREGFCLERCKSFVALMDTRGLGRLELEEFEALWEKFRKWTDIFVHFDKNRSQSLDYPEIIPALQAAGLQVDDFVLQLIGLRYTDPDLTISYPGFLHLLLKLDIMIGRFHSFHTLGNGTITLHYRQWLHSTMYN
ncbi:calpain-1 catalytic subunit [Lepisosteus oculatus]|uniref:calpain-1 catalytic subunit n=1 Tax=Lepisosteus oculatus TaxID=7918 RepID=UPI003722A367